MKKYRILSFILIMLLLVSGCGKTNKLEEPTKPNTEQSQTQSTPQEISKAASEKMKALSNYKMNMKMTMSMSAEGTTLEMITDADYTIDIKNNANYGQMTMSVMGMTSISEMYQLVKDGKVFSYSKEKDTDTWYVEEDTEEAMTSNEMFDLFDGELSYKEVTAKTSGAKAYEVTLTKEQVAKLTGDESINATIETITLAMEIKDDYIISMSLSMPAESDGMTMTVDLTINFSDFNTAGNVTIPNDVINKAVKQSTEQ